MRIITIPTIQELTTEWRCSFVARYWKNLKMAACVLRPVEGRVQRLIRRHRYPPAPGARTTIGTAGKYAAISERALRSAAVP